MRALPPRKKLPAGTRLRYLDPIGDPLHAVYREPCTIRRQYTTIFNKLKNTSHIYPPNQGNLISSGVMGEP
jgi:hypothetical protein